MLEKVYVPLDGSEVADAALVPGAELARRAGARLVLLAARWPGARESTMRSYLDAHVAFLGAPVESWVVTDTEPADAIAAAGAEAGALVCMATRGRGAFRAALLGSVAEAVVRTAQGPLVLVGPSFDRGWTLAERPAILVGTDGSDRARAAALAATDVAGAIDARIDLVCVLDPVDEARAGIARRSTKDVARLADLADELRARGADVSARPLDGFDPASVLQLHARDRASSLVAVGTHGRSGVSRAALGSVAFKVVRHSRLPVLVTGPEWIERR